MKPFPDNIAVVLPDGSSVTALDDSAVNRCLTLEAIIQELSGHYVELVLELLVSKRKNTPSFDEDFLKAKPVMDSIHGALELVADRLFEITDKEIGAPNSSGAIEQFKRELSKNGIDTRDDLDSEKPLTILMF